MNQKKKLSLIMLIVSCVSIIGAILLFFVAVPSATAAYKKGLEIVMGVLLILISALIAYYLWLTRDNDPNFFLFDRAKKRNIPVEALTFTTVNERMNIYLSMVCDSVEELWQDEILENERKLGYRKVYRPLLAYKMLYDLADKNTESYWSLLIQAKPETVDSLCSALAQGGETEMVKAFRYIMANYRGNPAKIKDFVIGNMKYIRGRMMGYVKKRIEFFY